MKKIYLLTLSIICVFTLNTLSAQNADFDFQVQYNLVDVEYTGGDTVFTGECMLSLNINASDVAAVEINVGSAQGLSDVKQLNIPYNHGTAMSLFNSNSKAMIHLGNLSPVKYYYQVRLKYQDETYSDYIEQNSIAN